MNATARRKLFLREPHLISDLPNLRSDDVLSGNRNHAPILELDSKTAAYPNCSVIGAINKPPDRAEGNEKMKCTARRATIIGLVLTIIGLAIPCSVTKASPIGSTATNPANGHQYIFLSSQSWLDAEAEALTLGGHLATVDNAAEDTWLWSTFGPASSYMTGVEYRFQNFWIGLSDYASRPPGSTVLGTFVWADGTPFTAASYTNWTLGAPAGESSGVPTPFVLKWGNHENVWNTPGEWTTGVGINNNGVQAADAFQFGVMEIVPEPSSFVLVGLGALAMLKVVRRMRRKDGCGSGRMR